MLDSFLEFIKTLSDPEKFGHLIETALTGWWVYVAMFGIIFAETGILLGFIFPGDSLLFTLGVVAGTGKLNLGLLIGLLIVAAVIGDTTGYFLGRKTGKAIFNKPDSFFFKQDYVTKTSHFYNKYGGKAIIFARFIPIVRSFTPFMAGVAQMPYKSFVKFSVAGSIVWVVLLTSLGFFLGNVPLIKNNFEKAILVVIVLSFMPAVIEFVAHKMKSRKV